MVPAGTRQLFQQSTAPEGWTRYTSSSIDNVAFRIVSGTSGGSGGGNVDFSTIFRNSATSTNSFTITRSETAVHNHSLVSGGSGSGGWRQCDADNSSFNVNRLSRAGSSLSHNHSMTNSLRYVNIMIATKDA